MLAVAVYTQLVCVCVCVWVCVCVCVCVYVCVCVCVCVVVDGGDGAVFHLWWPSAENVTFQSGVNDCILVCLWVSLHFFFF